jgi:hypothetical protein
MKKKRENLYGHVQSLAGAVLRASKQLCVQRANNKQMKCGCPPTENDAGILCSGPKPL